MSLPSEANVGDMVDFKWGKKMGVGQKNKNVQFYESFTNDGVEYFLYDCVYFYRTGDFETSIGKLVKIFEKPNHGKMVKVVWFLRPIDIRGYLGGYQPRWNELFLASGEGKGVSNINFLDSIIGKCSVVCTSKDKRNPEPSEAELKMADYFFSRTFDIGRLAIVDKFTDGIDGVKVEQFFNRKKDQKISNPQHVGTNIRPKIVIKKRTDPSGMPHCQVENKAEVSSSVNVIPKNSLHSFPYKKRKILEEELSTAQNREPTTEEEFDVRRRRAFCKPSQLGQNNVVKTWGKIIEVTRMPDAERRKWFKRVNWEERLQTAQNSGTLILLNNLDPSYTADAVEDLVWHALKEKVEARMIEWSPTFNPYYGRALVIFKTKGAAENAMSELKKKCLILGDGRTVSAMKATLRDPGKQNNFIGHLVIDRSGPQKQREEMKNAVSTSHCSQPNTIEYGMALEWRALHQKSDAWWNMLYQKQMKEVQDVMSSKNVLNFCKVT